MTNESRQFLWGSELRSKCEKVKIIWIQGDPKNVYI